MRAGAPEMALAVMGWPGVAIRSDTHDRFGRVDAHERLPAVGGAFGRRGRTGLARYLRMSRSQRER